MAGLDPAIQAPVVMAGSTGVMDRRVKPGDDKV
jgi:hypothetical protein